MRGKAIVFLAATAVCVAARASESEQRPDASTRIDVSLEQKGVASKHPLNGMPTGAKKLFARYNDLAFAQAPLTIARSDDKDKAFAWSVSKDSGGWILAFVTRNSTPVARRLVFTVDKRVPLTPTYRRVYSTDGGKTWRRIAFEPPHASISGLPQTLSAPYAIEVPPYSHQTATVRLK